MESMSIVIGVILYEVEMVIILGRQSAKSVVGIYCAYPGIVELRSKPKIGIIGICLHEHSFGDTVPDIHVQAFQCGTC